MFSDITPPNSQAETSGVWGVPDCLVHFDITFGIVVEMDKKMVLDTTLIAKASRKMLGVQKWKNSEAGTEQIGHHWAIGGFISRFGQRFIAWPLLCRLISGQKAPCLFVGSSDGMRQATFWDTALALVYQIAYLLGGLPTLGGPALRAVVDAYFSKAPFLNPCIEAGIGVISRLRHDSKGWDNPPPYSGRGRPRKWGLEWRLKDLLSFLTPQTITVCIYNKLEEVRCEYTNDEASYGCAGCLAARGDEKDTSCDYRRNKGTCPPC